MEGWMGQSVDRWIRVLSTWGKKVWVEITKNNKIKMRLLMAGEVARSTR